MAQKRYIVLAKVTDLSTIDGLNRLAYAEASNSAGKPILSGDPEIKEFIMELLKMLPATYDKEAAQALVQEAVEEVFI